MFNVLYNKEVIKRLDTEGEAKEFIHMDKHMLNRFGDYQIIEDKEERIIKTKWLENFEKLVSKQKELAKHPDAVLYIEGIQLLVNEVKRLWELRYNNFKEQNT